MVSYRCMPMFTARVEKRGSKAPKYAAFVALCGETRNGA